MQTNNLKFTEENIQAIFGHEAAEDEQPERLREYYFKNKVYDKIQVDLPLRILVGHKGIGKSALFKFAMHDEQQKGVLPLFLQPNEVLDQSIDSTNLLRAISQFKQALEKLIAERTLSEFGITQEGNLGKGLSLAGKVISIAHQALKPQADKLVDLSAPKKLVMEQFLKNRKITVFIDDLDRGWEGRLEDTRRLSALVNALRDLSNENPGLRFRLALRSDVYFLMRTSDESTDKVEGSVVWFSWTNHEILALLVKRIETFFGRTANEEKLRAMRQADLAEYLTSVMVPRFLGQGKWENAPVYRILMSLIRKRPRDLVKLCSTAARHAWDANHSIIATEDLRSSFVEYSQGRVQDTINEFRSELPDIERLVMGMKPSKQERTTAESYIYKTDALLKKIKDVQSQGQFLWRTGKTAEPKELANFLYKINFLTARKRTSDGIDRKFFEENRYLSSQFADFGYDWEIHPAYRWALQPDRVQDIFNELELSADGH